jgi:hypothetical protein
VPPPQADTVLKVNYLDTLEFYQKSQYFTITSIEFVKACAYHTTIPREI